MREEHPPYDVLIELSNLMSAGDAFLVQPATEISTLVRAMPIATHVVFVTTGAVTIVSSQDNTFDGAGALSLGEWIDDTKTTDSLFESLKERSIHRVFIEDGDGAVPRLDEKCRELEI